MFAAGFLLGSLINIGLDDGSRLTDDDLIIIVIIERKLVAYVHT